MFYLADLARKDVLDGDVSLGNNPSVHYDNLTRKCALKIDEQLFSVAKISVGNDITIANATQIAPSYDNGEGETVNPFGEICVGQRVYDVNGKFWGELENAEFTPKFVLKKIWVKDTEFKRGQIYGVGDAIIIKAKTPRQLLQKRTKALRATTTNTKGTLAKSEMQPTPKTTSGTTVSLPPTTAQSVTLPKRAFEQSGQIRKRYGNFNFLLGKTADKTIVNFQGEVMIKKTEKVTKEVLRQAKISGKLIELCLHVE